MTQYELNIRDYWRVIQKRYLVLVVVFFLVLIPTGIYTNMQTPLYRATASVQWMERQTVSSLLTQLVRVNASTTTDPLVTQSKIITSLPTLGNVVMELGLVSKQASEEEIRRQVAIIRGVVSTDIVPTTNIIRIHVTNENPQVAAKIANKIAEVYIAESLKEKSKQSRIVREFIEKQLEDVTPKLRASEETLLKFRKIVYPDGTIIPFRNEVKSWEDELRNLRQKYTDLHPDIIKTEARIAEFRFRKGANSMPQKEALLSRLQRDYEINVRTYINLKDKLVGARIAEAEKVEDASLVDPAATPVSPISPNKRSNYFFGAMIGFMLGLSGIFLAEQLDTSIGTIEDVESYLKIPVLGVIPYLMTKDEKKIGFIMRLWRKKVNIKGKEKALHMRNQLVIYYSSSSTIFEAYRILRTSIQSEVFKEKIQGKILLLSSSGPEEGKSITTSNLAVVMAQGGLRTLLIDGDMRRATIHKIFGMKNDPGLSNILRGTVEPKDAIRTFTDILISGIGFDEALRMPGLDNLHILAGGSLSGVPAELLASPEMAALLEGLRGKYDIILIDSPPVLAVTDATILASKVDGVILVYRVGKTSRSFLLRTKTQLTEAGAQVSGVILNNISPQMEILYGYNYYYKYYGKYYTQSPHKSKNTKKQL